MPGFIRTNPFQLPLLLQLLNGSPNGANIPAGTRRHFPAVDIAVFPDQYQNRFCGFERVKGYRSIYRGDFGQGLADNG